jgi:hypothetical protein
VQLSKWKEAGTEASLEMTAASSFGSMLSGKLRPVVRQRLTHIGLQYVHKQYEIETIQATSGENISAPRLGLLVIVCHMICCSDITKMDKAVLHQMVTLALEGLGSCDLLPPPAKILILASTLKLISVVPSSVGQSCKVSCV